MSRNIIRVNSERVVTTVEKIVVREGSENGFLAHTQQPLAKLQHRVSIEMGLYIL